MKRAWKAGLLALMMCLAFLCGCTSQQAETTAGVQTPVYTEPTELTTEATTLPEETTEPEPVYPEPDFSLDATHAFVYDATKGKLLFSKGDMQQKIAPASITKIYSAWVALQVLSPETVITAGDEVTLIDPESSVAHISVGQRLTVKQCVEGMLLQSGNDAAYVLAAAAGRHIAQSQELSTLVALGIFAGKMNELAHKNGLENTNFINPDGIDAAGHYTSLADLIKISQLVMEEPLIRQYAGMATDEVMYISGETRSWKNTNELLHPESQFYCEEAFGLKTGSTTNAGKCLISAFMYEDRMLFVGVLGGEENLLRYVDTLNLYHHYTGQPLEVYDLDPEDQSI